jgi:hypothetical protein
MRKALPLRDSPKEPKSGPKPVFLSKRERHLETDSDKKQKICFKMAYFIRFNFLAPQDDLLEEVELMNGSGTQFGDRGKKKNSDQRSFVA